MACSEDAVPKTRLLSVVVALFPAAAVMQVVIFADELAVKILEQPGHGRRRVDVDPQATVAAQFSPDDIIVTDPPLGKAHWKAHKSHGEECYKWNANNVEELLLDIGIESQERRRMFCEMMPSMKAPEKVDVVHNSVVPVEKEVESDPIEANLYRKGQPI